MGSFGSRNGFLEEAPWAGGGDAGLVGPEAILFLNGLFERRGDGLRSRGAIVAMLPDDNFVKRSGICLSCAGSCR